MLKLLIEILPKSRQFVWITQILRGDFLVELPRIRFVSRLVVGDGFLSAWLWPPRPIIALSGR